MRRITLKFKGQKSKILIGEKSSRFQKYIKPDKIIIITDKNINHLYGNLFKQHEVIIVEPGEGSKNLENINNIYKKLIDYEVDRSSFILGAGGGVVCDITGFVASTFMRGISFGFISSSLLSQVDASIGGKNGVNFLTYKNLIGTINQPQFVICDISMLKTLPRDEVFSGFSEIIKHALIADKNFFEYLYINTGELLSLDVKCLEDTIYRSLMIKREVVQKDEKEKSERRKLNFGHTVGHALEKSHGLSHGQAISLGMVISSKISLQKKYITHIEYGKIVELLKKFNLPVHINFDKNEIINSIRRDKKREQKYIHFILLKKIGKSKVEKMTFENLEKCINDLC